MTRSSNRAGRPQVDRYAVPVSAGHGGATGFLGRTEGRMGLYTAAHNLAVTDPRASWWPVDGWRWLIPTLDVHPAIDDGVHSLDVFSGAGAAVGGDARTPLFSWLEPQPEMVKDAARFDLVHHPELLEACRQRFAVVDLDAADHQLEASMRLTCVGLPGWASRASPWPYFPPAKNESQFAQVDGDGHIRAAGRAEKGFSGGPVFTDDGRFAGMLVASHRGWNAGVYFEHVRLISARDLLDL